MKREFLGFSTIELVISIVLIAISASVLLPLLLTLTSIKHVDHNAQAAELALQRMEIIVASKTINGFTNFSDPCQNTAYATTCSAGSSLCICNTNASGNTIAPPNFTVSSAITQNGDTKTITVTVSGEGDATLTTTVTNY